MVYNWVAVISGSRLGLVSRLTRHLHRLGAGLLRVVGRIRSELDAGVCVSTILDRFSGVGPAPGTGTSY